MHAIRAVSGSGTYRAGLDIQHGHAPGRARKADAVQGQVEPAGEHSGRDPQLSGAPGRRHPSL